MVRSDDRQEIASRLRCSLLKKPNGTALTLKNQEQDPPKNTKRTGVYKNICRNKLRDTATFLMFIIGTACLDAFSVLAVPRTHIFP